MTSKLTKYGILIIAAVLLAGLVFAGAGSADYVEVSTWDDLAYHVSEWTDKNEMRTVIVTQSIANETAGSNYEGILVTGNVTIMPASNAGNVKIDAKQTGRLFKVDEGSLTLIGNGTATLTLTGGNMSGTTTGLDRGGAVYVLNSAHLLLYSGAVISNCSATKEGGGVYSYGTVAMNNSTITNCNAIVFYGKGGGILVNSQGTFTMTGSCISNSGATSGGGVWVYGTFTMSNSNITNCYATSQGGGVYLYKGKFTMNNSTIANCGSTVQAGGVYGAYSDGGIFIMNNSTITNCYARSAGGVNFRGSDSTFFMNNSTITNCYVSESSGGGMMIECYGTVIMNNSTISNCRATTGGGGVIVCLMSTFTMNNSTISNCCANTDGGGVLVAKNDNTFNIKGNSIITSNTKNDGSANNVYLYENTSLTLVGDFTGNIGVVYAGAAPSINAVFGTATGTYIGAENIFADADNTLIGKMDGTSLVWQTTNPFHLYPGWNVISIPKKLSAAYDTAAELFGAVDTDNHPILAYNAQKKSWEQVMGSTVISPLNAYWVYSTKEIALPYVFSSTVSTPAVKDVYIGWNAVGLSADEPITAAVAFGNTDWYTYLEWNASAQAFKTPLIKGGSGIYADTTLVSLWTGGWLFLNEDGTYMGFTA